MSAHSVQFDRGPLGDGSRFANPSAIIRADNPADVPAAFAAMQDAQAAGKWLAGFASYELGYVLDAKLHPLLPERRKLPLMHFATFDRPVSPILTDDGPATLTRPAPLWDQARYSTAFRKLHDYISAGDVYQANLTFPLTATYSGTAPALYKKLCARQSVPHGVMVSLDDIALLSRSPELFFSLSATGRLTARPMKGTAPRSTHPRADDAHRKNLQTSKKNRAENLMIVDLLRNDLSRISQIGSVKVPELFVVERYATVHQMTSQIIAQINAGTSLAGIFTALFPCGSITGAPKIRAMEILADLEDHPRDAYCGSIGWIAPDGSMAFNVAIRTLMCHADGHVRMNVGGGIVYDSTAGDEYAEALLKAKFADLG